MLVLSRKENEKILFPHLGIALQILRLGSGKVRLGIEAPDDVSVVRHEIASSEQIEEFAERLRQSLENARRIRQSLVDLEDDKRRLLTLLAQEEATAKARRLELSELRSRCANCSGALRFECAPDEVAICPTCFEKQLAAGVRK